MSNKKLLSVCTRKPSTPGKYSLYLFVGNKMFVEWTLRLTDTS